MCDYEESSQLHRWSFDGSAQELDRCRSRANEIARELLSRAPDSEKAIKPTKDSTMISVVESFGCEYYRRNSKKEKEKQNDDGGDGGNNNTDGGCDQWSNHSGHPYMKPDEEELLVSFYVSKLPSLIGPMAQLPRLRIDEPKVTATAVCLARRFYLSNSVMLHDPKAIMVAAAFLGAKVEDATIDIRYLEDGTDLMNAPVSSSEILTAELALVKGIRFDLLCFHPYKAVDAFHSDLRTHLKSEKGKLLVTKKNNDNNKAGFIAGQDLKPMYDTARQLIDDVIVSDIPLYYSPGQIGLAALKVGNDDNTNEDVPNIDILGYIRERFKEDKHINNDHQKCDRIEQKIKTLCGMLRQLKNGEFGCGNHNVDLVKLKAINKKLKKCRVWGVKEKKNKKKRDRSSLDAGTGTTTTITSSDDRTTNVQQPDAKKAKSAK